MVGSLSTFLFFTDFSRTGVITLKAQESLVGGESGFRHDGTRVFLKENYLFTKNLGDTWVAQ